MMANEAGNHRPCRLFTAMRCRRDAPSQRSWRPRDAGIHAEAGILAPEPWTARLQLRDSAGFTPDFPHFSLTPSDEALCCAFGCRRTLPRGSEVVKDACKAGDHGRFVHNLLALGEAEYKGRAVILCLTDTGTALIERALVIHARVVPETWIDKCSEAERTALLQTLSRIGQ